MSPAQSDAVIGIAAGSSRSTQVKGVERDKNYKTVDHNNFILRAIDIIIASLLAAFLLPLFITISVLILLQGDGPIIFVQRRIGQSGKLFPCLKFRTMVSDAEVRLALLLAADVAAREEWQQDYKLRRDPRITALGHFLRKTSLDEFPQLFNVLRGDMSLVGPRPIVVEEAPRYGRHIRHYCDVRPGITGLWQISGRNNVSYRRRVACDVLYARRQSATLNIWIMLRTIPAVLAANGSY
jgi:exopolysaccharide production protein ExoY